MGLLPHRPKDFTGKHHCLEVHFNFVVCLALWGTTAFKDGLAVSVAVPFADWL